MEPADFSLAGQWALVTGASRGIGREVALHLARYGANLILTGRHKPGEPTGLDEVAEQIRSLGRRAERLYADLADATAIQDLARRALAIQTPIAILVHVAGVVFPRPALEQTLEEWETTLAVNLRAPFLLSQALVPAMMEGGGGRIIMISSAAGLVGFADRAAYAASKGGLVMLTRQLAVEWGPQGIRVNAILPGITYTDRVVQLMNARAEKNGTTPEVELEQATAGIPLRRSGTVEEFGKAVAFLLSPVAGYIHGAALPFDGGATASPL